MGEGGAALNVHQVVQRRCSLPLVYADGQVQGLSLPIDRKEVGVVQGPVPLDPAKEDAARAVLTSELDLSEGRIDIAQRWNDDPLDPSLGLGPHVGHESVISLAESGLQSRIMGHKGEE